MHSVGYMLVQEALVEKLFSWIWGEIQLALLSFCFIHFLLHRSSGTYTGTFMLLQTGILFPTFFFFYS